MWEVPCFQVEAQVGHFGGKSHHLQVDSLPFEAFEAMKLRVTLWNHMKLCSMKAQSAALKHNLTQGHEASICWSYSFQVICLLLLSVSLHPKIRKTREWIVNPWFWWVNSRQLAQQALKHFWKPTRVRRDSQPTALHSQAVSVCVIANVSVFHCKRTWEL